MQLPTDIDRKLLCFRSGEDHAMAQRMEEASVADPPLLLDQLIMHDGDVSGCTAEADPPQLAPEMQRCLKGRSLWGIFHPAVSQLREQHVGKRVFESLQ